MTELLSAGMVTLAVPVALTPASVQGGVSFAGVSVRLNTFAGPCGSLLPQAQTQTIAAGTSNTPKTARFMSASQQVEGQALSPLGGHPARATLQRRAPRAWPKG